VQVVTYLHVCFHDIVTMSVTRRHVSAMRSPLLLPVLVLAFVLSGAAGLVYLLAREGKRAAALLLAGAGLVLLGVLVARQGLPALAAPMLADAGTASTALARPSLSALLWSGLRSGLLTFGGAYTVIPFLQRDAVEVGGWMTNAQFLDGLALSGILPAPLIIFSTFVGYLGGGLPGALVLTVGIFLPAFAFTLLGHDFFERALHQPRLRLFLDGVTAGVVGLIAVTTVGLLRASLTGPLTLGIFALALAALFRWHSKFLIPLVIAGAALAGLLIRAG